MTRLDLRDRLRAVVDGLPDGARISLRAETIREWLREAQTEASKRDEPTRLLTTSQAAERLSVQPETVATWAKGGRFPNAFKTGEDGESGEWRIPPSDLEAVRTGDYASGDGRSGDRVHFSRN